MSLGYGVVQLDVTIVNTALNSIGGTLGGGVSELQWVVSAYTIAFAAFILTVTKVVAREGRSIRVVDQPMKGGGWVATFEDITEWQQAQEQISHMARHDALTNLPNRTLFREQLEQALRLAKRSDQLAVFCLDLDHFKDINNSLGHPIGDALLKQVAHRLGECIGENDTVADGGDEFASCNLQRQRRRQCALASQSSRGRRALRYRGHHSSSGSASAFRWHPRTDPINSSKCRSGALSRQGGRRGTYRFFGMPAPRPGGCWSSTCGWRCSATNSKSTISLFATSPATKSSCSKPWFAGTMRSAA